MGEPLRVLGWAYNYGHEARKVVEGERALRRFQRANPGGIVVPLVDGNAAEAERAQLLALLEEARAIIDTGHLANRSSREAHPWHERRRAWMARCEEVGR